MGEKALKMSGESVGRLEGVRADRRSDTTYYNPQTKQKRDAKGHITYNIRGNAGGDKINYRSPTSALKADMPVVKLLLHSVISDNANWMTIDIKDY